MQIHKNRITTGASGKPILYDVFLPEQKRAPIVLYLHGFNGFKDWGQFDLIAQQFAAAGFCFVKFNASHNGTTPEAPEDFADLEAYGQNNYTKELHDLHAMIDLVLDTHDALFSECDQNGVYLVGHSRGGGIVLLQAAADKRVKAVTTWASVAECKTPWGKWPAERLEQWKLTGVDYYVNSRTNQHLPLYYQLYEDYQNHAERLDIKAAVARLQVPLLICHGTKDEVVPVRAAQELFEAAGNASLFLLPSDHVFGRRHPWPHSHLPTAMQQVVDATVSFLKTSILKHK